ncbi:MAG: hypothetical protein M1834_002068 [Cirrosporium novae-zelandiae]|nr:MAG: hypothetical protein M1834_002068 [Cirrosporium novae-zelandiae]
MHRYRGASFGGGPSKASATTLCQKCLKRDKTSSIVRQDWKLTLSLRHYSYECKVTAQERPYLSRPSRTQQLSNPSLVPKLTSDVPNDLLRKKGIADEQLAKREKERARSRSSSVVRSRSRSRSSGRRRRSRPRSISTSSSGSVSTISTNLSRSGSLRRRQMDEDSENDQFYTSQNPVGLRGSSPPYRESRKRRHSSTSSSLSYISDSSTYKQRSKNSHEPPRNTRRRRSSNSPGERGRNFGNSRRSGRGRSRSGSRNKSFIARNRRSMTPEDKQSRSPMDFGRDGRNSRYEEEDTFANHGSDSMRNGSMRDREGRGSRMDHFNGGNQNRQLRRKERSLSPYAKRIALTQAMNIGR